MNISELSERKIDMLASPSMGNSRLLEFYRVNLKVKDTLDIKTASKEHAIDIISGKCSVKIQLSNNSIFEYLEIGGRDDIFSGLPEFLYIPRGSKYSIESHSDNFEAAICAVTATRDSKPLYIPGNAVKKNVSGRDNWKRDIYVGLGDGGPSTMLFIGETDSPQGNWSGYPPNKHSENNPPYERSFEELYYFKFKPDTGFALGGTYSDYRCRKETGHVSIYGDSQVFDAPSGYHFIAPSPGHRFRYIWVLGGVAEGFGQWPVDPHYEWLL